MNIRLLKLCILLSILNISYSNACHESGNSHCKAETGSSYSGANNNQNHELHNKLNFNENGDSDPKGFFDNNPYDKESLNKISKNSSLEKIKSNKQKEKFKKMFNEELKKLENDLDDFQTTKNYSNKLSNFLFSMNQFVYQDNNLSIDEKKELINNLNNLNREIVNKMQGKMMIKYDFGYFLSDLSKIFELPFSNMNSIKNKDFSPLSMIANFAFQNDNNSVLKLNSKKNDSLSLDEKINYTKSNIQDIDYINKLYQLYDNGNNQINFKSNEYNKNEIDFLVSNLNRKLRNMENKINNSKINNSFKENMLKYDISRVKKQIDDIQYYSAVLSVIGN